MKASRAEDRYYASWTRRPDRRRRHSSRRAPRAPRVRALVDHSRAAFVKSGAWAFYRDDRVAPGAYFTTRTFSTVTSAGLGANFEGWSSLTVELRTGVSWGGGLEPSYPGSNPTSLPIERRPNASTNEGIRTHTVLILNQAPPTNWATLA